MATSLTPEQKVLNKVATSLRDKAFRERQRAYDKEIADIRARHAESDLQKQVDEACDAMEHAIAARSAGLADIDRQIQELQAKRAQVDSSLSAPIEEARSKRNAAQARASASLSAATAEVEERYADVARCFSPAGWKPFQDFLPAASSPKAAG